MEKQPAVSIEFTPEEFTLMGNLVKASQARLYAGQPIFKSMNEKIDAAQKRLQTVCPHNFFTFPKLGTMCTWCGKKKLDLNTKTRN